MDFSEPKEFTHLVHVDKSFNWSMEDGTDVTDVFRKVRVIGEGGFGSVYEMEHIQSGIRMAGKAVKQENLTKASKSALAREIDLLRKILSPYTVKYYGSITWDRNPMILMEFCDRGSLRDIIEAKHIQFTENQISIIMNDVFMALVFLHNKHHILHRDIKAANILVNSEARFMLTDFGISRQFDTGKTMKTSSVIGTPFWMAPEVFSGDKYTFPADVWSAAITAVELAEGLPPLADLPFARAMIEISKHGFPGFRKGKKYTKEFVEFINLCTNMEASSRVKPEAILQHPFLKRAETLDRKKLFRQIISEPLDFSTLISEEEEEGFNDEEEEEEDARANLSTRELLEGYTHDIEIVDKPVEYEEPEPVKEEEVKNAAYYLDSVKQLSEQNKPLFYGVLLLILIVFVLLPGKLKIFCILIGVAAAVFYFKNQNKGSSEK